MPSASDVSLRTYFNSIKVQLEPYLAAQRNKHTKFQFHKGTIRTDEEHGPQ